MATHNRKHDAGGLRQRLSRWWHTDCPNCRRTRLIVLWALLMAPLVLWWISR